MTDLLAPLVVTLGLLVVGVVSWSRTRASRRGGTTVPADLGPFPAVLFFSSGACESCPPARQVVAESTSGEFREYSWDVHPGILRRLRVDRVPTTWVIDADGRVTERLEGTPAPASLRRAIADD